MLDPLFFAAQGETLLLAAVLRGADGVPQGLAGASVTVSARRYGHQAPAINAASCSIVDPAGSISYDGGLVTLAPGFYEVVFTAVLSNGKTRKFPNEGYELLLVTAAI